jgi:hypothetical protein
MNRMLRSLLASGFAAAGLAIFTPSCSDNNSSLFITNVLYPPPPQCTITADVTSTALGSGTLDLEFTKSYKAALLVGNQLTSRGSKQTLRTETSRVTLRGAEITLTTSTGQELYKFSVNGTGFVDVSRGEDSGFGLFGTELIPASIGEKLTEDLMIPAGGSNQVIALVRVFGTTLGNQELTSSELSFPITVCTGCLIEYPLAALVPIGPNGATQVCARGATELPVPGCRPGQDDKIDCRACAATHDLCMSPPGSEPVPEADAGL